jgi:hypothetical protein
MTDRFMIEVGGTAPCDHPQGSCNVDIGFPSLFLDGNRVANGIQITDVMGTTVGPGTYLLNFTEYGIRVVGGHEVFIDETWLGETNFDFPYKDHKFGPRATAIEINSNDHYIVNSIVFSSKIGVDVRGAANLISGVHVWFPDNEAEAFGAIAFQNTGYGNRYDGCYIDGSRMNIVNPRQVLWTNGMILSGIGIVIMGESVDRLQITQTNFLGGSISHTSETGGPPAVATVVKDSRIENNVFSQWTGFPGAKATKASMSLTQSNATQWLFNFSSILIFPTITRVRHSLSSADGFARTIARPARGAVVLIETDLPVTGTVLVDVDTAEYTGGFA